MNDTLSEKQKEKLKGLLSDLEAELDLALANPESQTKTQQLDQSRVGRLSRMDAMQQRQMAKASKEQMTIRLQLTRQALRRISTDEFGECLDCGEYISFERLCARPEAPFCLDCQKRKEK